jgi:hypothetical protein
MDLRGQNIYLQRMVSTYMILLLLAPRQTTQLCQGQSQTHWTKSKVLENTGTTPQLFHFLARYIQFGWV